METNFRKTPRLFKVGLKNQITIKDFGDISLEEDEQVTFNSKSGAKYDFTKKNWGFYATPSLAGRLRNHGYKALIMRNKETRQCYVVLVEIGHEQEFNCYCQDENQEVLMFLDNFEKLANMPIEK